MRALRQEELQRSLDMTARLLAGRDVKVTHRGGKAFVAWDKNYNISRINLPMVPNGAPEEVIRALQGYLDHEIGHVYHTDPEIYSQAAKSALLNGQDVKKAKLFVNIIEDVRIEREIQKELPGSVYNLEEVRKLVIDGHVQQALDKAAGNDKVRRAIGLMPFFRARGGQKIAQDFMNRNDLWKLYADIDAVMPDLDKRLTEMRFTEDAVKLTMDVMNALKAKDEERKEEKKKDDKKKDDKKKDDKKSPPKPDEDGEGDEEEDEDGETKEDEDAEDEDESEDESEESDEDGEGEEGEGEDESEGDEEGDEDGEGSSEDEGDAEDEEGEGGSAAEDAVEGEDEEEAEDEGLLGSLDPNDGMDFDDAAEKALESAIAGIHDDSPARDYTRDFDRIETAPVISGVNVAVMEAAVDKTSGVLQKILLRLIASRSQTFNTPGFRRGRLHAPSLHKMDVEDDRVFSRRHVTVSRKTAVVLLVDLSGSMGGDKAKVALESAWAFAEVLSTLKVPCEVVGFTTDSPKYAALRSDPAIAKDWNEYNASVGCITRLEPLYMPIFKAFNEGFGPLQKQRMASATSHYTGAPLYQQNTDGQSLRYAAFRLLPRKEDRKVLIVFSDGMPCNSNQPGSVLARDLQNAVKEINRAGIETIGIGIQSDAVKQFYPRWVVIKKTEELVTTVMGELTRILAPNK